MSESHAERVPLSKLRQAVADLMSLSQRTIPQFTVEAEVDVSAVVRVREALAIRVQERFDAKLSPVDFFVQACARALREHPAVNASYVQEAGEKGGFIEYYCAVHIGLATAVADGILVPVIPEADRLELGAIARARQDAVRRAQEGRMTAADYLATFTISNLGPFNVARFNAMVIPPQAAILAVGTAVPRPVAAGETVVVRPIVSLSLSADHRIVDGVAAARFLNTVVAHIEQPADTPAAGGGEQDFRS